MVDVHTQISNVKVYTRARPDNHPPRIEVEISYTDEANGLRYSMQVVYDHPEFTRFTLARCLEKLFDALDEGKR